MNARVDGRRYVLDMWHEQARLAIELDGQAYHSGDVARQRDVTEMPTSRPLGSSPSVSRMPTSPAARSGVETV
ncbi:hypothetical protein [Ornithinimicrobium sp. INDO-MA30-4]|uniref:hypothetical protein n=1 Tax=Ornithinimicrobium sp. INDO-MA30-4 TaxID=2908651 RepID=UPI001F458A1D|nr:hypothetical protein [Ornithinimicrobium sp. INDO-MA30-4]UJH70158.1 hypothetical protein L0A91_13325 [Ornithinimicrobium sp. INDO-MA30-4]